MALPAVLPRLAAFTGVQALWISRALDRVSAALDRIGTRLDRVEGRLDLLSERVARLEAGRPVR